MTAGVVVLGLHEGAALFLRRGPDPSWLDQLRKRHFVLLQRHDDDLFGLTWADLRVSEKELDWQSGSCAKAPVLALADAAAERAPPWQIHARGVVCDFRRARLFTPRGDQLKNATMQLLGLVSLFAEPISMERAGDRLGLRRTRKQPGQNARMAVTRARNDLRAKAPEVGDILVVRHGALGFDRSVVVVPSSSGETVRAHLDDAAGTIAGRRSGEEEKAHQRPVVEQRDPRDAIDPQICALVAAHVAGLPDPREPHRARPGALNQR